MQKRFFVTTLWALILGAQILTIPQSLAVDYRSRPATAVKGPREDRILRVALGLARATEVLSPEQASEIFKRLENGQAMPPEFSNDWQKLLRMAQAMEIVQTMPNFFAVGYEYETLHKQKLAYEYFEKGADKFEALIAAHFGVRNSQVWEEHAHIRDDQKRVWDLGLEWIRPNDEYPSGFELGTPPIFQRSDLQQVAAFTWQLGESKWGQSSAMTGGHQTFSVVPMGAQADPKTIALMLTNLTLLHAQYGPSIAKLLDVRRRGGMAENFFFRPIQLDHAELLADLQNLNPNQISYEQVQKIFREKHIDKEFEIQRYNYIHRAGFSRPDQDEIIKDMETWSQDKKRNFRRNWKYRDSQIKFNLKNPEKTLFEIRIGDWIADRPEQTILETAVYQMLLNRAWEMAEAGQLFKAKLVQRKQGQNDVSFWKSIESNPASSVDSFLNFLNLPNDQWAEFIKGQGFELTKAPLKTSNKTVFAFEMEGWSEELVELILPRDPQLRVEWRDMNSKQKIKTMEDMGYSFEADYSRKQHRVLTTEFYADTDRFPYLAHDLHLETSGNWEIKSNIQGFSNLQDIQKAIAQMNVRIREGYGMHMHIFLPQNVFDQMSPTKIDQFVDYLERLSLLMQLRGYAESGLRQAPHNLDSWSLDRYSPADLKAVKNHLLGKEKMNFLTQKYHNVGFRPLEGGIDIELRDLGDDHKYAMTLMTQLQESIESGNFGELGFSEDPAVFMEFRDHQENSPAVQRYTLAQAMGQKQKLSKEDNDLLRLMQFEIYKPSMQEYMHFADFATLEETKDNELDVAFVRANFENNIAIPLLNWEEQRFLKTSDKKKILVAREEFLNGVSRILETVKNDGRYAFMKGNKNFLHLCDYLKRSTHKTRPNFNLVSEKQSGEQQEILEDLVMKLRGLVVKFVKDTQVDDMVEQSLQGSARLSQPTAPVKAKSRAAQCQEALR